MNPTEDVMMSKPDFFRSDWEWSKNYPVTQMVRTGDFLWLAGQVSVDERGVVVGEGDIQAQARQIFRNMRHILGLAGCDLTSVIRLTNYFTVSLTDEKAKFAYWEIRREFFGDHRPASTGLQVGSLGRPGLILEIDAIALCSSEGLNLTKYRSLIVGMTDDEQEC